LANQTRIIAPEAARIIMTYRVEAGHNWYAAPDPAHIEPASFGDSLWQIEQLIHDVVEESDEGIPAAGAPRPALPTGCRVTLLGFEQGAVLALTLACLWPELVERTIAVCGYLPGVRGWEPPARTMDGLPVLLIHDPHDPLPLTARAERTVELLTRRAAKPQIVPVPRARELGCAVTEAVRQWWDQ
jgi:pimeloyl-ACP methyl ester carboxylesterase